MRKSRFGLFALLAAVSFSCAPPVSRSGDYGKIAIALSGRPGRTLETGWPSGTVPGFAAVSVRVSGVDMGDVTATASGSANSLTVQVPAGTNRLVQVTAVPSAGGGAPYFAKTYAGSAAVDIAAGETKTLSIKLGLAATKLALAAPQAKPWNYYIAAADSLDSAVQTGTTAVSIDGLSDLEFDDYGRLFVSAANWGIQRFSSLTAPFESVIPDYPGSIGGMAYQKSSGRLFFTFETGKGRALAYVDPGTGSWEPIDLGVRGLVLESAVAADDTAVYVATSDGISSFTVDQAGTAVPISSVSLDSLGINSEGLLIQDLAVHDGLLFVGAGIDWTAFLGGEVNVAAYAVPDTDEGGDSPGIAAGALIAMEATSLSALWTIDWSTAADLAPPDFTLYGGPLRFIGFAQGTLYAIEAGFQMASEEEINFVSRIVEINQQKRAVTAIGGERTVESIIWFLGGLPPEAQ